MELREDIGSEYSGSPVRLARGLEHLRWVELLKIHSDVCWKVDFKEALEIHGHTRAQVEKPVRVSCNLGNSQLNAKVLDWNDVWLELAGIESQLAPLSLDIEWRLLDSCRQRLSILDYKDPVIVDARHYWVLEVPALNNDLGA